MTALQFRINATVLVLVLTAACESPLSTDVAAPVLTVGVGNATVTAFHAEVKGPITQFGSNRSTELPYWPSCANGAFICASATISTFGTAEYSYTLDAQAPLSASCASYEATVVFRLSDGSELTMNEVGTVCGHGESFRRVPAPGGSFGNPVEGAGSWSVASATGQFSGMTGGGTDTFVSAGANTSATYTGILED